ncbi:tripartite tricarboxylate transporter TctB family protein [Marinobacter sp. BSs20148]|jgi:hypothetical protein|uniref:tripartite tricarboxylate transporter TctB family protein n=1 Tax=Marinobacter sp. BSs20148 TaxID=490759 RepID=UPI0002776948|nr:tripartite tricarboxylate transporter TctB family protein [Marinobacter sp. BSs20148]AFP30302.1 hypothetical protein MRBBS_1364 [Marinobacter sp. BSs20148]
MKTIRLPFSAGIIPALLLLGLAVGGWLIALEWERSSGMFPRFLGVIFIGLAALELGIHVFKSVFGKAETVVDLEELRKQLWGFGWLSLLLLMIYLLGFMVTVVLYVFLFLRFHGRFSYLLSTAIAVGSVAFVYLIFRRLLEYSLFPGILW